MTADGPFALRSALTRDDLPAAFHRWRTVLPAGASRPTEAGEWAGALVLVEHGELDVECSVGGERHFEAGDLLALGWLPLRSLHNRGAVPVELLAVRRRGASPTSSFLHVLRAGRDASRRDG